MTRRAAMAVSNSSMYRSSRQILPKRFVYYTAATVSFILLTVVVCSTTLFFVLDDSTVPPTHLPVVPALSPQKRLLRSDKPDRAFTVSPLRYPLDYDTFTVRINTWKRPEQLEVSIAHHKTCKSVAHIQVVWCMEQGEPPRWLEEDDFVTVERHNVNSLNERFRAFEEPPTAGVLSIDDDVLRPCIALESGFRKWTMNPDRQVGFDARSHEVEKTNRWKYAYMSTTEHTNRYSITLTRCSFTHRDYLTWYTTKMPESIRDTVAKNFNCEDIAMSLGISSLTGARPPLLADYWAVKSQIKLYVDSKISEGNQHKDLRDDCMDTFADVLHLKSRMRTEKLKRGDAFEYGSKGDNWNRKYSKDEQQIIHRWKKLGFDTMMKEIADLRAEASRYAYERGLLEGSRPWKLRFGKNQ